MKPHNQSHFPSSEYSRLRIHVSPRNIQTFAQTTIFICSNIWQIRNRRDSKFIDKNWVKKIFIKLFFPIALQPKFSVPIDKPISLATQRHDKNSQLWSLFCKKNWTNSTDDLSIRLIAIRYKLDRTVRRSNLVRLQLHLINKGPYLRQSHWINKHSFNNGPRLNRLNSPVIAMSAHAQR